MRKKWGSYSVLIEAKNFKLKILELKPGASTSLQKHKHRSEFWVFLHDMSCKLIKENELHRLKNDGKKKMRVLELQFGERCLESDIKRLRD